jgi:hypothetical protein
MRPMVHTAIIFGPWPHGPPCIFRMSFCILYAFSIVTKYSK